MAAAAGSPTDSDRTMLLNGLVERARAMVPELLRRAPGAEELRRIPDETIRDFNDAEFFKIFLPRRFGGFELDLRQADIEGAEAVIEVNALFGGGEIKVPETWHVVVSGMGIFGGYLIAIFYFHLPPLSYFQPMKVHIVPFDFATGMIKSFVFSILIVAVCCYKGMRTSGGAAGVGRATTQSVVTSYILILISDFFLTMFLNMIHMKMVT